jgi:hypothetical protein
MRLKTSSSSLMTGNYVGGKFIPSMFGPSAKQTEPYFSERIAAEGR